MTVALAIVILVTPFAIAAALSWATHRDAARLVSHSPDYFPDYESYRAGHDIDVIRTRFEHDPAWPTAGVLGERR